MKLKRRLQLMWLHRKWVIQSVYNTKGFKKSSEYLELEKETDRLYHKALRGGDKLEIEKAKGRVEIVKWLKEIE